MMEKDRAKLFSEQFHIDRRDITYQFDEGLYQTQTPHHTFVE